MGDLAVNQRQGAGEQHDHQTEHQQIVQQAGVQPRHGDAGQQAAEPGFDTLVQRYARFALVAAAGVQRAAQRADRRSIGRAPGHVGFLVGVAAHPALDLALLAMRVQ
ncbi:hypothetical protein D3C78_1515820 [compost metagenome]